MNNRRALLLVCLGIVSLTAPASPDAHLGPVFVQAKPPPDPREAGASRDARRADAWSDSESVQALSTLPIVRATLSNGLRVVMSPEHSIPTVAVVVYYDVGSRNEEKGRSGFAHLFEHMMFQGSANVPKGEYFRLITNRGGSFNGTTDVDRTNYFATLPSNELALGLWLEADRMRSLNVTQENFENQRQTVMEERRQSVENRPYVPSMLKINELAYGSYWPYSHSTIGDMKDLQDAPLSAVQDFFRTYYAPNNAVLSISGDFQPEQALALVRQYFDDIPSRQVRKFTPPALEPQTAEVVAKTTDANAELAAFHVAYRIPAARTPDHYPLELLSVILGDGESSRLYQKLVKQSELAQEIAVGTDDRRGPDLFSIWCILSKGKSAEQARRVIFDELDLIAKRGVSSKELEKAKNRAKAAFVFSLESNLSRAQQLGEFEMYWGDARLLRQELHRYLSVSAADIQRVAGEYFSPTNRTVLDVVPEARP
jgi:zinc protease